LFFRAVTFSGAPRPVVSATFGSPARALVIGVIAVST
jgi:hypothetical protein